MNKEYKINLFKEILKGGTNFKINKDKLNDLKYITSILNNLELIDRLEGMVIIIRDELEVFKEYYSRHIDSLNQDTLSFLKKTNLDERYYGDFLDSVYKFYSGRGIFSKINLEKTKIIGEELDYFWFSEMFFITDINDVDNFLVIKTKRDIIPIEAKIIITNQLIACYLAGSIHRPIVNGSGDVVNNIADIENQYNEIKFNFDFVSELFSYIEKVEEEVIKARSGISFYINK